MIQISGSKLDALVQRASLDRELLLLALELGEQIRVLPRLPASGAKEVDPVL